MKQSAETGRSLWKLLLKTIDVNNNAALTCSECFAILEYLADADLAGVDRDILLPLARQHLHACPDRQQYYRQRLDQLASSETDSLEEPAPADDSTDYEERR
jgi:hypothetical protein